MTTTVVTFADLGLRCSVWGDPHCGHFARWTIQRRTEDNVTTNVLHACPTHLVDGLANALDLTGAQRWEARQQNKVIDVPTCGASTPTGFGHPVALCTREPHRGGDHSATIHGGQVYLWR